MTRTAAAVQPAVARGCRWSLAPLVSPVEAVPPPPEDVAAGWCHYQPDGRRGVPSRRTRASPPFVSPGQAVTAGQTVMLIEAMKTFNQIKAPKAGTVGKIMVTKRAAGRIRAAAPGYRLADWE